MAGAVKFGDPKIYLESLLGGMLLELIVRALLLGRRSDLEGRSRGNWSMAEDYRDTAGFVELLIINGEVALEAGKELSVEKMMTTLISTLMRVEETARHGALLRRIKSGGKSQRHRANKRRNAARILNRIRA